MEKGKDFTIEEKHKRVKEFRPIDDAFFEVLANDIDFCQEMSRIHRQNRDLKILKILSLFIFRSLTSLKKIG